MADMRLPFLVRIIAATIISVLLAPLACANAGEHAFEISAGSAPAALREFGRQADIQLLFDFDAVDGIETKALAGTFEVEAALRLLLQGTGLSFGRVNERTLAIRTRADPYQDAAWPSEPVEAGRATNDQSGSVRAVEQWRLVRVEEVREEVSSRTVEEPDERDGKNNEIVVTGTNIRGAELVGQQLNVFDREDIERAGVNSIDEVRNLLPQNFSGSGTDSFSSNAGQESAATRDSTNVGSVSSFNLRGLGTAATLTLLNGRRIAPSGVGDIFGVSAMPVSLVERIEVVPDGGSAIYGSDAVGGVVNIITRRDFEGFETSARYGTTISGGRDDLGVNALAGHGWRSGNLFVLADYSERSALYARDRDYIGDEVDDIATLAPNDDRVSLFATLNQELNQRLRLGLDALWTERQVFDTTSSSVFGLTEPIPVELKNQAYHAAGRGEFDLSDNWLIGLNADYSVHKSSSVLPGNSSRYDNKASTLELSLAGTAARLPAGPARVALGALLRKEELESVGTGSPFLEREVRGAYGEVLLPLVSSPMSVPLVRELTLSLAARWDDYSNGENRVTPKYGVSWKAGEGLSFRASFAEAFRAPTMFQQADQQQMFFVGFPYFNLDPADQNPNFSPGSAYVAAYNRQGNPDLIPETADIFTAGVDFEPAVLPGLRTSVTYFDIDYTDVIFSIFAFLRLNDPAFADFRTESPDPDYVQSLLGGAETVLNFTAIPIDVQQVQVLMDAGVHNVASLRTSGVDLQSSYAFEVGPGALDVSFNATYVMEYLLQGTRQTPAENNVDRVGDPLRFRARAAAGYSVGAWTLSAAMNFQDSYIDDIFSPLAPVRVDSYATLDLGVHYRSAVRAAPGWLDNMRFSLNLRNALDEDPPFVDDPSGFNFDAANASPLGRFISLRMTKGWGL